MKHMPTAPTTNVPSNLSVTITKDKVLVNDKREVEVNKGASKVVIQRFYLSDWQKDGWKTSEDIKLEAEKRMQEAKLKAKEVKKEVSDAE